MTQLIDYTKLDYLAEVKRYVAHPDATAIAKLQQHLGIALQQQDAALVACSDAAERQRIVDSFLKKKLALSADDAALAKSVQAVCERMQGDRDKLRVTFYYLLAEAHGKLGSL